MTIVPVRQDVRRVFLRESLQQKFRNSRFHGIRDEIRLNAAARKSRAARSAPAAKIRRSAM